MIGAGKIVQWLGTLAVLPRDLSLLLSTHMWQITTVSITLALGDLTPSSSLHGYPYICACTHSHKHRHAHINK